MDRLARPSLILTKREAYAGEELVAKLGAAFVSGAIGIKLQDREDYAADLAIWLQALGNDKRCIFTAATQAQAAADWLLSRMAVDTSPEFEGGGMTNAHDIGPEGDRAVARLIYDSARTRRLEGWQAVNRAQHSGRV